MQIYYMKKNIIYLIKEIIPIIVGILIALFINNWNENRKDKEYIDHIFSSIRKEFVETNKNIIDKLALQKVFIDTLEFYLEDDKVSILKITLKAGGINIPSIRMDSWKAISSSRIELIDYDKLSSLVSIEEARENLKMKTEKLMDFTYSNINETSKDKKTIIKILMFDIIATEKAMQEVIEDIINDE